MIQFILTGGVVLGVVFCVGYVVGYHKADTNVRREWVRFIKR